MGGQKRNNSGMHGGWARWVFTSWTGRGLLTFFGALCAFAVLSVRTDRQITNFLGEYRTSVNEVILSDVTEKSIRQLSRQLTCGLGESGAAAVRKLAETHEIRREMDQLLNGSKGDIAREAASVLSIVKEIENASETGIYVERVVDGGEAHRLIVALDYQWQLLRKTLREHELNRRKIQVRDAEDSLSLRSQLLAVLGLFALAGLVAPLWLSRSAREKFRVQVDSLAKGNYGYQIPVKSLDELGDIVENLNGLSSRLQAEKKKENDERDRSQRFLRQLNFSLESTLEGDYVREFRPSSQGAWAEVARNVNRHLSLVAEWVARDAALQSEKARTISVRKDSLMQLEKLFRVEGRELKRIVGTFNSDDPLRSIAVAISAALGTQEESLAKIQEKMKRILEGSLSTIQVVTERESEMEKEYEYIHDTSSTVDEVSVTAKESAQMVLHVFEASQKAMETAESGRDLVQQSIQGMTRITDQVNTIAHNILGLSSKSLEIGNIVRAIGEISKQTNLLALNAAIEAAGAGEHGKGFAVVAKEIRELAVKSATSAQSIERLIMQMKDATSTAVLSTEEGTKSVQAGVRYINLLNDSFGMILEKFQEVVESAQQISSAAQEQTVGARQVASTMASIDRMMLTSLNELGQMRGHLEGYQELAGEFDKLVRRRQERSYEGQ